MAAPIRNPVSAGTGSRKPMVGTSIVGAAVALCMLFVDRPLALWLDSHYRGTAVYGVGAAILRPLDGLLLIGALLLLGAGAWTLSSAKPPTWISQFVSAGLAAAVTLAVTVLLKLAVGRSQVAPGFLRQHVYGFHLFDGSRAYSAFPSATMSVASACLAGFGLGRVVERVRAGLLLVVLTLALLATNSHWFADIVGGTYLGLVIGTAVHHRADAKRRQVGA